MDTGGIQYCRLHAASIWQKGVSRTAYGQHDLGTGPLGVLGNVLWPVLAGWWLAILHLINAAALAITIIGIPFAWAHIKLAAIALWPIGRMIVTVEEAEALSKN